MRKTILCVDARAHWVMPDEKKEGQQFRMVLRGAPLRLRAGADGGTDLYFVALQRLTPYYDEEAREYRCGTDEYWYTVSDESEREIVSWHWHPYAFQDPHIHVPAIDGHIPTGRVSLEGVVRFLIEDLEVDPAREDWDTTLADQETRHRTYRTWS